MLRTTHCEVDLDLLAHNVRIIKRELAAQSASKKIHLAAVLKADAYGMGAVPAAAVLLEEGVDMLAVACLPEALELRKHYPDACIFIMGHTPDEYLKPVVEQNLICSIFRASQAETLSALALRHKKTVKVHVKIDSGMNRLGIKPDSTTVALLQDMAALPGLELEGIFTHLALCDHDSDHAQFKLFQTLCSAAQDAGINFRYKHVCDSIGMLRYPEFCLDMVRVGASLYGVIPMRTPVSDTIDLRVPYAFKTRISRISRLEAGEGVGYDYSWRAPAAGAVIATLPVGYADGYKRCMGNTAEVLIHGERARVVGIACMDQCTVDVTHIQDLSEGDDVLLLGFDGAADSQNAGKEVPVAELAKWAKTNRNEVLASIGRRVPRLYRQKGQVVFQKDYLLEEECHTNE